MIGGNRRQILIISPRTYCPVLYIFVFFYFHYLHKIDKVPLQLFVKSRGDGKRVAKGVFKHHPSTVIKPEINQVYMC